VTGLSIFIRPLLLALCVAGALALSACGREGAARQAPEVVFRELCVALQYRNQDAILARLGPQTRAALDAMEGSSIQLGAAWVPMAADIRSLSRRTDDQGRTWLQVESQFGLTHEILAVESETAWTFELSLGTAVADSAQPGSGTEATPESPDAVVPQ
jgi:hypothetical protein